MTKPPFLKPNDQIRIVSPAGSIFPEQVEGATKTLTSWGFRPTEGSYTRNSYGRYAGTAAERTKDMQAAINDTDVKAILCSRGGYGIAQIIDKIDFAPLVNNPKWLIGYSDNTIFHNALTNLGIASVHGLMAKQLTDLAEDSEPKTYLKDILSGRLPTYSIETNKMNRTGISRGKLIGGNLSVLFGLRGSQFDLPYSGNTLFIEDIGEHAYHIDRMMQNLRFSGVLKSLSGLIVGQFTKCKEDPQMKQTIQEIILSSVSDYNYPVCFGFPAGHEDFSLSFILNTEVELSVGSDRTTIVYL